MTLSEELTWRGFLYQTTFKDIAAVDGEPLGFYFGVDPSADSMTVGNLAAAMMVRHFIDHGHKAFLLVGGATGMIGDPDGKKQERDLKTFDEITHNKEAIAGQYRTIFADKDFEIVDNYDWFRDMGYLQFLREVGKHVPMRQMLGREFVQTRLGEEGNGISYAEFSYSLIQAYDFLHLFQEKGVRLQLCGADQWGNCIAGVDLIRRLTGEEANVWSTPLVVNKATGVKFGKSEAGAVWLDPAKTSPEQFYQFWINLDDEGVEDYLKVYTLLGPEDVMAVMDEFNANRAGRAGRVAQKRLAYEVTKLVHGEAAAEAARAAAENLQADSGAAGLTAVKAAKDGSIIEALVAAGLVSSKSEARSLFASGGIYLNNQPVERENFTPDDFAGGPVQLRRGKKLQNTCLVEPAD